MVGLWMGRLQTENHPSFMIYRRNPELNLATLH
jgi:hypothetical protein